MLITTPRYKNLFCQTLKHVASCTWVSTLLYCNMPICYTKPVVIEQNNIQFLIIAKLCSSHNDPQFGHILRQTPSRQARINKYISCIRQTRTRKWRLKKKMKWDESVVLFLYVLHAALISVLSTVLRKIKTQIYVTLYYMYVSVNCGGCVY